MTPLKSTRIKSNYSCKQEELYQVLLLGWDSYLQEQPEFEAVSTIYTALYGTDQRNAVLVAKAMPDYQARDEASETLHIQLEEAADLAMIQWKYLESNIMKAYPDNLHKPKLEAAGSAHYKKAGNNDWESVSALMESGANFITTNLVDLTAGGMPLAFPVAFQDSRTAFETLYTQFKDAEQAKEQARDAKIVANNQVFLITSKMFKDGQKIFRNDAATRERFVFDKILELVSGGTDPQPVIYNIQLVTNQTENGTAILQLKGEAGKTAEIIWGDLIRNSIIFDGTEQTFSHTYTIAREYQIMVRTGNNLLYFTAQNCKITNILKFPPELTLIERIIFSVNQLTSFPDISTFVNIKHFNLNDNQLAEVDSYIIKINTFQTNDGEIDLSGGGNPLPNGTTAPAIQELKARGWIVTTTTFPTP